MEPSDAILTSRTSLALGSDCRQAERMGLTAGASQSGIFESLSIDWHILSLLILHSPSLSHAGSVERQCQQLLSPLIHESAMLLIEK